MPRKIVHTIEQPTLAWLFDFSPDMLTLDVHTEDDKFICQCVRTLAKDISEFVCVSSCPNDLFGMNGGSVILRDRLCDIVLRGVSGNVLYTYQCALFDFV